MASIDNIRDLELFQIVADLGSFTDAAAVAGVSQPTVSLAIKRLEKRLGVALLDRRRFGAGGGTSLTEAGVVLRRRAAVILEELGRLPDALAATGGPRLFRIGLPPMIAAYLLGEKSTGRSIESMRAELAEQLGIGVQVRSNGSNKLLEAIERHELDCGAVASVSGGPHVEGVESFRIASFPFGVAFAQDGPFAERLIEAAGEGRRFDFADGALLEGLRFVTLDEDYVHAQTATVFLEHTVEKSRLIEVSDVGAMRAIIASGVAVGLMARLAVPQDGRFGFLPLAGDPLPDFDVYIFNDTIRAAETMAIEEAAAGVRDVGGRQSSGGSAGSGVQAFLRFIGRADGML